MLIVIIWWFVDAKVNYSSHNIILGEHRLLMSVLLLFIELVQGTKNQC